MYNKIIEEMAKDIYCAIRNECKLNTYGHCNDCEFNVPENTNEINCQSYLVGKILTQMNYRKIPEGSVVLTREELQELKKYKTDWLNSEKMHLQAELEDTEFELSCTNEMFSTLSKLYDETLEKLKKYTEFNNNLIVEKQKLKDELILTRKETAREIITEMFNQIKSYENIDIILNLIAKQYGVEVE